MEKIMSVPTADVLQRTLESDPWQCTLSESLYGLLEQLSVPDGGFTVDAWRLQPVSGGYAVSCHPEISRVLATVREGDLLEYLLTHGEILERDGNAFGGWRDPSDGRVYLDCSTIVDDLDTAIQLAKDHDQLAVWDFAAGKSISTV